MSISSILNLADSGMNGETIHENCNCEMCQEDIPKDFEIVCEKCIENLSEEKQTCCNKYNLILTCPSKQSYYVCSKCMTIKFFIPVSDLNQRKTLPIICSCEDVNSYFMIERVDRVRVVCKACQKSATVKYSKERCCYELWSEGRCPLCLANPVRVSTSLDFVGDNAYDCDDCRAHFRASPEIKEKFGKDDLLGQPQCLTKLDDFRFVRPGDLILLNDKEPPVLCIESDKEKGEFFYMNNEGKLCSRTIEDFPHRFHRIEFLARNRRASSEVVEEAMDIIRSGGTGNAQIVSLPISVKIWLNNLLDLSSLPVRDYRIVKKCPHAKCKMLFTRSTLIEFKEYSILLKCTACGHEYEVPDIPEQRALLTNVRKSEEVEIKTIEDLGDADLIKLPRSNVYSHYAICKEVHRDSQEVTLVELGLETEGHRICISEKRKPFSQIAGNLVLRFYPLDCLSTERVKRRAQDLMDHRDLQPTYQFFHFNCQHFAMWCKTNRMCSEDGEYYENLYGYVYTGINLSALLLPLLRPVSVGIIALDAFLKTIYSKYCPTNEEGISLPPVDASNEHRSLRDFLMTLRIHDSL